MVKKFILYVKNKYKLKGFNDDDNKIEIDGYCHRWEIIIRCQLMIT